jgi:hypothetical protein
VKCETCKFFDPEEDSDEGRCRRHAPRHDSFTCWPITNNDDWCGEWKPKAKAPPERLPDYLNPYHSSFDGQG